MLGACVFGLSTLQFGFLLNGIISYSDHCQRLLAKAQCFATAILWVDVAR
jgi:hypothetical protein